MILFRKHISWFRGLAFILMLHLFNYSMNMEDHRLLNEVGVSDESNEIETFAELLLTLIFQDKGALPDEANDIDETKVFQGIIAVIPAAFTFKSRFFYYLEPVNFQHYLNNYLNLVNEICPPPPKARV